MPPALLDATEWDLEVPGGPGSRNSLDCEPTRADSYTHQLLRRPSSDCGFIFATPSSTSSGSSVELALAAHPPPSGAGGQVLVGLPRRGRHLRGGCLASDVLEERRPHEGAPMAHAGRVDRLVSAHLGVLGNRPRARARVGWGALPDLCAGLIVPMLLALATTACFAYNSIPQHLGPPHRRGCAGGASTALARCAVGYVGKPGNQVHTDPATARDPRLTQARRVISSPVMLHCRSCRRYLFEGCLGPVAPRVGLLGFSPTASGV